MPRSPTGNEAPPVTFRVQLLRSGPRAWDRVRRMAVHLERAEWGARAFPPEEMRAQFVSESAVIAVAWDEYETLAAFACAGPGDNHGREAVLFNILVSPRFRGRGLVWRLLDTVERELGRCDYQALRIDARVSNGFADRIWRRYGERARVTRADHSSPYGLQRTYVVDITSLER